jgi:hypothetical protein
MAARKTKNTLPFNSVKIGYVDADVIAIEGRELQKRDGIFGEWNGKTHEIEYDINMAEAEKVNTLLHEVLHGLNHVWGIKYDSLDQEEEIVNALGGALATFFKDNKKFLEWVMTTFHGE